MSTVDIFGNTLRELNKAMAETEIANALDLIDFDAYDDKELSRLSSELAKKVSMIELENNMFDTYLARVIPVGKDDENQITLQDQDAAGADRGKEARREKKKKGEKVKEMDRPVLLTSEQKSDIAIRELEELKDQIQRDKEDWGKIVDNYKVPAAM
ncbi:hypothetical protein HDU91_002695 [Kappamyces sp. JEL0680]|nr:hypothetical protein HDU91_002695 [Kappamyces sp. JEL0680]